tara:strand:- start:4683 stop:5558 length:876 start_codon:yes stop_codon:yes gene_type:complete
MEKDQIIILEDRGLISISGNDKEEFLQNIITNDIKKVNSGNSIFSAILSPQGKYLFEFFITLSNNEFFLDCDGDSTKKLVFHLAKYKLSSKIEIKDLSEKYAVGIINYDKFLQISPQKKNTIEFRNSLVFIDPREKKLGARILSPLEKLYLTVKKLNLKIVNNNIYYKKAYLLGIPEKGLENLQDQLFGLEANFEKLNAIDFKKGCYVGQENTARMKLKNKIRRKLFPIITNEKINKGDELLFKNKKVGKILIDKPFPFGLIKLYDPDFQSFKNEDLLAQNKKCKILDNVE